MSAQFLVCLGMDGLRLAIGAKPRKFSPRQIAVLMTALADQAEPIPLERAVLNAHAQFGGDLPQMLRAYAEAEALSSALSETTK